jgi:hypothetical protein
MANGSLTGADAGRAVQGAATGAAAGAVIGTAVPVIGTAVGAGVGAVVGGLSGLFGGGPEAQQAESNVGGRSIDARKIWEQIHPGSSTSLSEGASAASKLQEVHDARAQQIDAINKTMDAAWQGDSSAQVQAGAHPLGIWLKDSASNLEKSGTYLNNQGEDFDTAKHKVQEIASKPPESGFLDSVNPWSDKDEEINKYNQQGQANVQAFNAYYQASQQNAAGMPQYKAWEGNNFSGGDGNGNGNTGDGSGGGGGGNFPGGGSGGGGAGNLPKFDGNTPSTNLPGMDGSGSGKYGTNMPKFDPSDSGGYKTPSFDGTAAAGYTPPSSDFSNNFGPGGSQFGPGTGGGQGPGGGSGNFGPGGVGGFGPTGGALGAGASTGAGAGAAGAAGAMRGGAGMGAGAAGRAGAAGMGGMGAGAGRGKGGEDEEHQTKYLIGDDPNELFGTDELTAPPVIGE